MHIVIALVISFFVATFVNMMLPWGVAGLLPWGIVFVVSFLVLKKMLRKEKPLPLPADFKARYAHDNIAMDTESGKLWIRDRSGSRVVDRSDILRWNRTFRTGNGAAEVNNALEIHLRDLDRPKSVVQFKRHNDFWKSGAARNAQESEEWVSRLTTWVNDT